MNDKALQKAADMIQHQERIFKLSDFLSKSDIIPAHFKGKPANCFIALEMANRLGIDFFELANGLYVVHGRPGFSGTFTIGRINASGLFKTKLQFKTIGKNDQMEVTAFAESIDGTHCEATVSMHTAIAEGWSKNPKYKTMPEQMLTYRSACFFCRKHCPQVLMGARTVDEIEDEVIAETVKAPDLVPALQIANEEIAKEQKAKDNLEKIEELFVEAEKAGVNSETLKKFSATIDLDDTESVEKGIDNLLTIIADKKISKG